MAKLCDDVVLCRGLPEQPPTEDNYLHTLKSAGYNCDYLYTSRFEFINSLDLKTCLQMPDDYHGNIYIYICVCTCYKHIYASIICDSI